MSGRERGGKGLGSTGGPDENMIAASSSIAVVPGPEELAPAVGGVAAATAKTVEGIAKYAKTSELKALLSELYSEVTVKQPDDVVAFMIECLETKKK